MRARALAGVVLLVLLFACKSERKSKNDDIAACNATGGRWVEGGCNDNGHCEKTAGMIDDDDESNAEPDDEGQDESSREL